MFFRGGSASDPVFQMSRGFPHKVLSTAIKTDPHKGYLSGPNMVGQKRWERDRKIVGDDPLPDTRLFNVKSPGRWGFLGGRLSHAYSLAYILD